MWKISSTWFFVALIILTVIFFFLVKNVCAAGYYLNPGECANINGTDVCAFNVTMYSFNETCWNYFNSSLISKMDVLNSSMSDLKNYCRLENFSAVYTDLSSCTGDKLRISNELELIKQSSNESRLCYERLDRYVGMNASYTSLQANYNSLQKAKKSVDDSLMYYAGGGFLAGVAVCYFWLKKGVSGSKGVETGRESMMGER